MSASVATIRVVGVGDEVGFTGPSHGSRCSATGCFWDSQLDGETQIWMNLQVWKGDFEPRQQVRRQFVKEGRVVGEADLDQL